MHTWYESLFSILASFTKTFIVIVLVAWALIGLWKVALRKFKDACKANCGYADLMEAPPEGELFCKYPKLRLIEAWFASHKDQFNQLGIVITALMSYANIWLMAFWVVFGLLAGVESSVSYVLELVGLTAWRIEGRSIIAITAASYATVWIVKLTFRNFFVALPEFAAGLTLNVISKKFKKYRQGVSLKWPQEEVKPHMFFSLERVTVNFLAKYVTSDGGVAMVEGSYSYSPSEERLEKYAAVDDKSIGTAILNMAKGNLTAEISKRSADKALMDTAEIKTEIEKLYDGDCQIETDLGFDLHEFTLVSIGFDKDTQDAMLASFSSRTMFKGFENNPSAREDILIVAKRVTKEIKDHRINGKIEGLENIGPALLAMIAPFLNRGGGRGNRPGGQGGQAQPATP